MPDKYRFLLFDDDREVELIWSGKTAEICNNDTMKIAGGDGVMEPLMHANKRELIYNYEEKLAFIGVYSQLT